MLALRGEPVAMHENPGMITAAHRKASINTKADAIPEHAVRAAMQESVGLLLSLFLGVGRAALEVFGGHSWGGVLRGNNEEKQQQQ